MLLSNWFKIKIPQTIREALNFIFSKVEEAKAGSIEGDFAQLFGDDILKYALYVIGFAAMMGVFMYFMRQTIIVMSRLIEYDLRKSIFKKYEALDSTFYKTNKTGDLMSRVAEDVSKVRMYLGPALLYGINLLGLCVLVIYAMLKVNVQLTLYTLLPLPFLSLAIYYVSSLINKKSERIQQQLSTLTASAQEVYSGIRVVKSYGSEDRFRNFFSEESEVFKEKSMDLARVNALFFPTMILIISLSTLLTIYVSGRLVGENAIEPGTIAEFVIYVNYLTWPFTSIGWIASIIQQADASQKRINEILEAPIDILNTGQLKTELQGQIHFDNVSFTYPDTGVKALDRVTFDLKKGEKLAIMGKTASGKSSICELLLRMYDVSSGKILLDGQVLNDLDLHSLRNQIGYVPQDVFLFSDSIANNIKFGKTAASMQAVETLAKAAAVHEDIIGFPEGYATEVGERGVTLSGGQKQRISIARALIKDPEIVLLDDCLSAVDTNTEKIILEYLKEELENKTTIIVTHRILHHITFDKILILDEGRVVEYGSPTELLQAGGSYHTMVENQK